MKSRSKDIKFSEDIARISAFRSATRMASPAERVAAGKALRDKIPRKRGPGVTNSDLLVINKTDLAPHVQANLGVMDRDARAVRGDRPFVFTNCFTGDGLGEVANGIEQVINRLHPSPSGSPT